MVACHWALAVILIMERPSLPLENLISLPVLLLPTKKMKVARLPGPRRPFAIVDADRPKAGPGEVVVKIVASGVCHSDLHIARGEFESVKYPIILGHEPAGYVFEFGEGVTGLKKGEPVIVYPARGCGRCWFCLRGEENHCEDGKFIGLSRRQSRGVACSPRWRLCCRSRCRRTRAHRDSTSQEDEHMLDNSGRRETAKPLIGREAGVRPDYPRQKEHGHSCPKSGEERSRRGYSWSSEQLVAT